MDNNVQLARSVKCDNSIDMANRSYNWPFARFDFHKLDIPHYSV